MVASTVNAFAAHCDIVVVVVNRLEKLAEVFYTYVGDLKLLASDLELDADAVDVVFHYWLLKRKVSACAFVFRVSAFLSVQTAENLLFDTHAHLRFFIRPAFLELLQVRPAVPESKLLGIVVTIPDTQPTYALLT